MVGVIKYDQFKQYFFSEADQTKDELTKELNQNKPLIQADVVENTVNKNNSSINTNDHLVEVGQLILIRLIMLRLRTSACKC